MFPLVQILLLLHNRGHSCLFWKPGRHLLLAVAVVTNQVGGVAEVAGDLARGGSGGEPVGNTSDTRDTLDRDTVESKTSNVGSSHGGTADAVGGGVAGVPGRENVRAGAEDVEDGAPVGVGGNGPVAVNSTDSDSARSRSRRNVGSVLSLVTGSNGGENTGAGSRLNSVVESSRVTTTKRHADDGDSGSALGDDIVGSPVEASENDGSAGRAALEDLDSLDGSLLSDTVGLSSNGTSDVSSVTVGIGVLAAEGSVDSLSTALEVVVSGSDTGVNDIGVGALASIGIVDVGGRSPGSVRDRSESPGSASLAGQGTLGESNILLGLIDKVDGPDTVLLDLGDLCHCQHGLE